MKLISLIDEDFVNYKKPSMYLIFPNCSFKCNIDCGKNVCQNYNIINYNNIEISKESVCERYLSNPITKAIVCAGLEPFDSYFDLVPFIDTLRVDYKCNDPVIIYTGYKEEEFLGIEHYAYKYSTPQDVLVNQYNQLLKYNNIIIKFGRFIPNSESIHDDVLGVSLASNNQYAKKIC